MKFIREINMGLSIIFIIGSLLLISIGFRMWFVYKGKEELQVLGVFIAIITITFNIAPILKHACDLSTISESKENLKMYETETSIMKGYLDTNIKGADGNYMPFGALLLLEKMRVMQEMTLANNRIKKRSTGASAWVVKLFGE